MTEPDVNAKQEPHLLKREDSYLLTRWVYLRLLGLVYLSAFGSLETQILGLNGSKGILPTADFFRNLLIAQGQTDVNLALFPTLSWFNASDGFLIGMTISGIVLSLLVTLGILTGPCLVILATLWLSFNTGGGEFSGFQSDGMLVEATVMSLFLAPWCLVEAPWPVPSKYCQSSPPSLLSLWLIRFMAFRLMFASGLVKLFSGDATWQNFTAMCYHWETQPIPTPLAWVVFQLPKSINEFATAFTLFSELVAPLLIFGTRPFRLSGAIIMILLQIGIILTGNYTFLNYLTIALCVPFIDDAFHKRLIPIWLEEKNRRTLRAARARIEQACVPPNEYLRIAASIPALILLGFAILKLSFIVVDSNSMPPFVSQSMEWLSQYRVINSYGMFAVMTTTRPEIEFEGSDDGVSWTAYAFPVKPGDLKRPPAFVAPHMPRLDWRLWFAAMEPAQANPWVANFIRRLLEGSPDVLALLKENPFPSKPPKYIRSTVYDYHFTDWKTLMETGCWWRRDNSRPYMPVLMLENGELVPCQP